jgi:hypothetical protein
MALVIDSGVLYAALDRTDSAHVRCKELIRSTRERRVLPAPILPEVDWFVSKHLGAGVMIALTRDIAGGAFDVADLTDTDYARVAEVLEEYDDQDVGFVDAAVLAIVERLGERKVATLDHRHFSVLRTRSGRALRLLPA